MHKLLKILLAGLVCLGSMATAFADESAGVLPCTLTAENGTPSGSFPTRTAPPNWTGPAAPSRWRAQSPSPGSISSGTVRPNPGPHCRQPDPLGRGIRLPA